METSAKANLNVEEAFFTLARDIKAKTERKQGPSSGGGGGRVPLGSGAGQQKKGLFGGWSCSIL